MTNRNLYPLFLSAVLILSFQNCGRGFSAAGSASAAAGAGPGTSGSPVLLERAISELQPISFKVDGVGALAFPDGLPKGVVYDEATRRLGWVPIKGQAGDYSVRVVENGVEKGTVKFKVTPVDSGLLRLAGPPFQYNDGDIGYVFVHGSGSVDRCADRAELDSYWGSGVPTIAPDAANRLVACYDGRKAVADVSESVANQILGAKCGRFKKCIIITHSMGGLLMEHMFLHTREARAGDPEPRMYDNRELYKAVRDKTLFVISLASTAGGSKAATVINEGGSIGQDIVSAVSRYLGKNDDSTRNLVVAYASTIAAPYTEDPAVPFFMVPTYSVKTIAEESGKFGGILDLVGNSVPRTVFNGSRTLAFFDTVASFHSRSDGLVDFRSGCGVASASDNDGPGRDAALDTHFRYCFEAPKKPNHFVWFASNMNHFIVTSLYGDCTHPDSPCVTRVPGAAAGTLVVDGSLTGLSAVEVIRRKLAPSVSALRFASSLRE